MEKKTQKQVENPIKEIKRLGKYAIGEIKVSDIRLLEKNARFMKKETFDTLTNNIGRDKELSSVPFCHVEQLSGEVTVLSGNHRVKAAMVNELETIVVMYNTGEMTEDEKTSLQISHNSLSGEDDGQILKELFDSIQDLDLKLGTGLDNEFFDKLLNSQASLIESTEIPTITATLLFTDEQIESIGKAIDGITSDEFILCGDKGMFDKYLHMSKAIKENYNILNSGYIFEALYDIYKKYMETNENGFDGDMTIEGYKCMKIGGTNMLIKENSATKLRKYIAECDDIDDFVNTIGTLFSD